MYLLAFLKSTVLQKLNAFFCEMNKSRVEGLLRKNP